MLDHISVIIPVYNRAEYLYGAIESVLAQTHNNLEIIIINDNSTDKIDDVIFEYKKYENILFLRNYKNRGVSFSRNIGIRKSKYNLIALLDSDDKWKKNKLELELKFLKSNPQINIVHTEEIWIRNGVRVNQKKKHKKNGGDIFIPSLELCLMSPSSVLMKKTVFDKYGYFNESMPVCEDYDLWLKITLHEEVGFIDKPLTIKYGGHDDQLSRKYEAIDSYRVLSMLNLINYYEIDGVKKEAIINTLKRKLLILSNGALKRDKKESYEYYSNLLLKVNEI